MDLFSIWLLSWILSIFVGMIIGTSKNRLGAALAATFFLGWIGVIIIACLPALKKCAFCGKYIDMSAIICPYCYRDQRDALPKE